MEQKIQNIDAGYRKVVDLLIEKGIKVIECVPFNEGRYYFIRTDEASNYLICYKREFYLSFGKEFQSEGASGLGESINLNDLKMAVAHGVNNLIFVYPTGAIYSISVENFLLKSFKRTNKEGKETRSISIQELRRENGI